MSEHWKKQLDQEVMDTCSMNLGERRTIRVLIDTKSRTIRGLLATDSIEETHLHQAIERIKETTNDHLTKEQLTNFNAGFLVGGIIMYTPEQKDFQGALVPTTLNTNTAVNYTQRTLEQAQKILDEYLYRSTLVATRSVKIALRAA